MKHRFGYRKCTLLLRPGRCLSFTNHNIFTASVPFFPYTRDSFTHVRNIPRIGIRTGRIIKRDRTIGFDCLLTFRIDYNRIIAGNINQVVQVDSVVCNFDHYPYSARTYARQLIIRASNVTERSLVTECRLLNTNRSDDNPNGFNIEGFEIVENKDISTRKR